MKVRIGTARLAVGAGVAVVLAGAVTATPLAASPRVAATSMVAAPATYSVRTFAAPFSPGDRQFVSRNGKYILTVSGNAVTRTSDGKLLGKILGGEGVVVGVTNDGTVFGYAEHGKGTGIYSQGLTESYKWRGGHLTWLTPTDLGSKVFGCANAANLQSEIHAIDANGTGVGFELATCGNDPVQILAVYFNGTTFQTTGDAKATHGGPTFYPTNAVAYTANGVTVGDARNPAGSGLSVWTGLHASPVLLSTFVHIPAAQALLQSRFWNDSKHFVGADMNGSSLGEQLWNGKRAVEIAGTSAMTFQPQALSEDDMVVGDVESGPTAAKVWTQAGGLRTLQSMVHTKDFLTGATAVDGLGDIFGVAQTPADTAAVYFEATPISASHPPTVSITSPRSGHSYKKGAMLNASYACKAGKTETLTSCKGTVKNHKKIRASKVGKHSFKVVAIDADGEKTTKTVHYKIKR
jgi:hypothetical protein